MSAPTRPEASMAMSFPVVSSLQSFKISLRARCVMLQKRNRIQSALSRAFMMLTMNATWDGSLANCEKILAVSMKNGAPGGCPTSSL